MRCVSEVYFYHLTRQRVDQALRPLLGKCLANGWRVVIRGSEAAQIHQLDDALWQGPAEEFLPHGLAGTEQEADQPVLLALEGHEAPHDCLICIGGSAVTADEVSIQQARVHPVSRRQWPGPAKGARAMEVADRGGDCGEILEPSPRQLGASGRKSRQHRINAERFANRISAAG